MSLPAAWIDRIFNKLTMAYGHDFLRRWEGLDMDAVKADWAHELGGFVLQPARITYALENIPSDRPPTARQFRVLCNGGGHKPDPLPAIGYAGDRPPPHIMDRVHSLALTLRSERRHPHAWAEKLMARRDNGEVLSRAQREALERFEEGTASLSFSHVDGAGFNPIPPELWPWNKSEAGR